MDLLPRLLPDVNSPERFIIAMASIVFIWLTFERYRS